MFCFVLFSPKMKQIHPHSYWKLKLVKLNRLQRELVSKLVSSASVGGAARALEVLSQEGSGGPDMQARSPRLPVTRLNVRAGLFAPGGG